MGAGKTVEIMELFFQPNYHYFSCLLIQADVIDEEECSTGYLLVIVKKGQKGMSLEHCGFRVE